MKVRHPNPPAITRLPNCLLRTGVRVPPHRTPYFFFSALRFYKVHTGSRSQRNRNLLRAVPLFARADQVRRGSPVTLVFPPAQLRPLHVPYLNVIPAFYLSPHESIWGIRN